MVIPAHNEEVALPRLLSMIRAQDLDGHRLQVVVAVNGSTDATAAKARQQVDLFAAARHELIVAEAGVASKAAALNLGDRLASAFPRIYLDADIELSSTAIKRTIEVLASTDEPRLAAPRILLGDSSLNASRRYGRIWSQLPYVRSHVPGVGFYAVNRAGRGRWWRFPSRIGADDKFVRLHFSDDEAVVIDDASFTVFLPERLSELIRVRGRWNDLNRQIVQHCPRLVRRDGSRWLSSARHIVATSSTWPDVPVFLVVWTAARVYSRVTGAGRRERWARADSSPARRPDPGPVARSSHNWVKRNVCQSEPAGRQSVHVIVVTYRSRDTIVGCLDRILRSEGIGGLRVTVVDNASGDGGPDLVRSKFPAVEVITNRANLGFAAAVNQVALSSDRSWIALISPDVEVRKETLARAVEHLTSNPDTGSVGVRAVRSDGAINDRSFFMRPTVWSEFALAVGAHRIVPSSGILNPEQYLAYRSSERAMAVDIVAGCFNVISADLFKHLGGYDEQFFLCGEDFDFGLRAIEAGAAPQIVPTLPILHRSGSSFPDSVHARAAHLRGRSQFETRWWSGRALTLARTFRALGLLARRVLAHALVLDGRDDLDRLWAMRSQWEAGASRTPPAGMGAAVAA